jgi:hypothetical protein
LVNECADTVAAEMLDQRPGCEAARPARQFRHVVRRVTLAVIGERKITGGDGHRAAVSQLVADDGVTAIVGRLQPFVTVHRPTVRPFDTGGQVTLVRRCLSPEAEGAIDMHPGLPATGKLDQFGEAVTGAGVDLSCLENRDAGTVDGGDCFGEGLREDSALIIRCDTQDAVMAESQELQGGKDRRMRVVAD